MPRFLPDLAPWRSSRDFRLMWSSGLITNFGSALTLVAVPVQLKELTGSPLAVGAVGAVELIPLILFGLYGGALADALDRRKLIVYTEATLGLLVVALLVNALLSHPMVWPLYVLAALSSALGGLQRPALDAMIPRVVPHDQLIAASALNALRWQIGSIAGPSLAGLLITLAGLQWAYVIDVATFAVSVALSLRLRPSPAPRGAGKPSLRSIADGARYAWRRKELLGTYAVDVAQTGLGFPIAVFPFLADDLDAPWSLGLMYAALPAGALVVSLTSGWSSRIHHHGRMQILSATTFGLTMTMAGLADNVWLVLLLLTVAGGCDAISGIFRQTIWNQTIPDELRGRLAGFEMLSIAGLQLGQVRAGGMAAVVGVRTSIWSGGLMCVAAAGLLAISLPKLMSYDARTDEHAARQRVIAAERYDSTAAETGVPSEDRQSKR
ncbi:MFS transporter [Streptomyces sp. NPDC003697]